MGTEAHGLLVGMKSLDRVIIVSDTLKTETSQIFIS